MQKAILYTRVSTDEQAEKGYSLRDQKEQLEKWCAEKQVHPVAHFQDDHSAKTFDRPEFKKLLKFAKSNKSTIDYLLVPKWDRFSRNITDAYAMISTLRNMGIIVNATQQWIDFEIPEQQFMLAIYVANSQVENDVRSNRTKSAMRKAMREGRWMHQAPYGYKFEYETKHKKKLVINEEEAKFVREAFEETALGISSGAVIRRRLKEKGLSIQKSQFNRMLKKVAYMGKILIPNWKTEPEEIADGIHEPIIPEHLFYKVQDIISSNPRSDKDHRIKYSTFGDSFPLRGFLICVACGGNLTGSFGAGRHGGKWPYYHCRDSCRERHKEDLISQAFLERLRQIKISPSIRALFEKIFLETWKKKNKDRDRELVRLDSEILKNEKERFAAELRLIKNEIQQDSFQRVKEYYDKEIAKLTLKRNNITLTESDYPKRLNFGLKLLSNIDEYYIQAKLEAKQKLVKVLFDGKIIYENGKCQTPNEMKIVSAISMFNNDLQGKKKKEAPVNCASGPFGTPCNTLFEHLVKLHAFKRYAG